MSSPSRYLPKLELFSFFSFVFFTVNRPSPAECIASNPCELSTHNCSVLASCKSSQPGKYRCTCNAGFAGDGINCGNDTDADGIPDKALPCTSKSCMKDNCVSLPNSGQEDFDGDGRGL